MSSSSPCEPTEQKEAVMTTTKIGKIEFLVPFLPFDICQFPTFSLILRQARATLADTECLLLSFNAAMHSVSDWDGGREAEMTMFVRSSQLTLLLIIVFIIDIPKCCTVCSQQSVDIVVDYYVYF